VKHNEIFEIDGIEIEYTFCFVEQLKERYIDFYEKFSAQKYVIFVDKRVDDISILQKIMPIFKTGEIATGLNVENEGLTYYLFIQEEDYILLDLIKKSQIFIDIRFCLRHKYRYEHDSTATTTPKRPKGVSVPARTLGVRFISHWLYTIE
jgi:hypothetical protein